jgi:hypothetical protein
MAGGTHKQREQRAASGALFAYDAAVHCGGLFWTNALLVENYNRAATATIQGSEEATADFDLHVRSWFISCNQLFLA